MKDKHITEILDAKAFGELGADELETVRAHAADCASCHRAVEAAQLSSILLTAHAEIPATQPSAFFQSKVLNAIREKQNIRRPVAAFWRWWQASYPLVCSMVLVVLTFGALTAFAPKAETEEAISSYNLYSTDSVILNQKPPRNLTTEQALEVIYTERRDAVRK